MWDVYLQHPCKNRRKQFILRGGFTYFLCSPLLGEMIQCDKYFCPDGLVQPPTSISWCRILEPSAIYQTVKVHQANWLRARAMGFHTSQLVTAGLPDYHLHPEILRNNVSIYMFQIPDSNLVPSYCRWQGGCGNMCFFLAGVWEEGHDTNSLLGRYQWNNFFPNLSLSFSLLVCLRLRYWKLN